MMTPFLKWPGGKRWFVQRFPHLLPTAFNQYIEPFLGGGSVFFHLQPTKALLGDANPELVAAYKGIKSAWRKIEALLEEHQRRHSNEYYYFVRDNIPGDWIERAARVIYLNRTCFNGIYRVNLKGVFNVPCGSKTDVLMNGDDFSASSRLLRNADIRLADFEELINQAKKNDLIFADPPYTVRHNLNGFVKYNEKLFSWDDQKRLANSLKRAKKRGAIVVSTNANHDSVRQLYQDSDFHLMSVSRYSSISAQSESRRNFDELIILSHPPSSRKQK